MNRLFLNSIFFLLSGVLPLVIGLRVASFNIRHFGDSLMGRNDVVANLVTIFQNFDLVFVMETRDADMSSVLTFITALGADQWNYKASDPIGRTSYKERYVFYYRPAVVNILETYQYDDSSHDRFEREPFSVLIQYNSSTTGEKVKVALTGAHIAPLNVFAELQALPNVMDAVADTFQDASAVIAMGDFNADCGYLSDTNKNRLAIFTDPQYLSLIPNDADTTVASTNCAYDRIVVKGDIENQISDAGVYNFQEILHLSYLDAWSISDHYPVEFTLKEVLPVATDPRVASFNIRRFGDALMGRNDVVANLVTIFQNFDLVFVVETRDADMSSVHKFISALGEDQWNYTASDPLGRDGYKERYVFYYRPTVVDIVETYQYDDSSHDRFEREPFSVLIEYTSSVTGEKMRAALTGAHIDSNNVFAELEELPNVMDAVANTFQNASVVIAMGDFSADCRQLSDANKNSLAIFTDPQYRSLIPDDADTTTTATDCAYDRIVVKGARGQISDAGVYNFQDELNLSYPDAWSLSNHYPVTFTLKEVLPLATGPRIASFNIRHFGDGLMGRDDAVDNLVTIFQNFDLVFVMETRDADMSSVHTFITALGADQWNYKTSDPIGRTNYKERYIFYYRPAVVNILETYLYDDSSQDIFEREPFSVLIQYNSSATGERVKVALTGAHIAPDHVFEELQALPNVMDAVADTFDDACAFIAMGDFNADCGYLSDANKNRLAIFSDPQYRSLIPNDADTTVAATNCAYDRIIVKGDAQNPTANAGVYNFQEILNLNYPDAWSVSDHYPVEFTLTDQVHWNCP